MEKLLVIPGAQKCGTTSVFKSLIQNASINTASTPDEYQFDEYKEIEFFANEKEVVEQNIDWYENLFNSPDGAYPIDASPIYLISEQVPKLIDEFVDEVKVIILIRDPIKRAYSGYWQNKSNLYKEDRSFKEILNHIEGGDFQTVRKSENDMLYRAMSRGSICERPTGSIRTENYFSNKYKNASFSADYQDPVALYKYFQMSSYSNYIKMYEEYLGSHNVEVVIFEKLIRQSSKELSNIASFLGISDENLTLSSANTQSRVPKKNVPDNLIRYLNSIMDEYKFPSVFETAIGFSINRSMYTNKPEIPEELYKEGKNKLEYEYEYWSSEYPEIDSLWSY